MQHFALFLQVILLCIAYTLSQQFNFNNNGAPPPPRFLVPGAFPLNQPQPQPKRLNPENDNAVQRLRRPIGRSRSAAPPPASLVPLEPELLSPSSPRNVPPPQSFESSSIQPRPVVEEEEENTESDAPLVSTITAPINTATPKTFRPSIQFRPTKPQFFANTNIIDEEDNEFQTTRAQAPQIQTTVQEPQQFQRKQATRVQNFRQPSPPPQPEIVENKISRQFERPIKPKFEKSEIPEKRVKKPVAQVLRRYREDNPDGSITWGFENDDGSFKEETIGNDCVTKGKYGYIDPDGVRREYSYSSGLPCDKNKLEQTEEGNSPAGYIDYSGNKVVLSNGDSIDLNNMVKNRARKPVQKFRN